MKKKSLIFGASLLLLGSFGFQSCIGSFALTNKVLTWNKNVDNKFVNELVFFAFWVLPVYEVTAVADLLVINSIEFWSGNTPLEANNQLIKTDHGNYEIMADETGYKVCTPNGDIMNFEYDGESKIWSFCLNSGEKTDFLKFTDNNHVEMPGFNGEFVDVELSPEGVEQYYSSITQPMMAMN